MKSFNHTSVHPEVMNLPKAVNGNHSSATQWQKSEGGVLKPVDTINLMSKYPGAGKDTMQKRLVDNLPAGTKVEQIGIGNIVRWHVQNQTALGLELAKHPKDKLVPDELIFRMTEEYLATLDPSAIWIVNGLPRKFEQIEFHDQTMDKFGRRVMGVLFQVDRDEADARMRIRAERPEDLVPEKRKNRLDEADSVFDPVIEHFQSSGKLIAVDAMPKPDIVQAELFKRVQKLGIPLNQRVQ